MKTAVILFNLGAPDKLESVKPFLFNLFNDPAIIRLPHPFRYILAKLISILRFKKAQNIYKQIGGKSPLLENTLAQAHALENSLGEQYKVFTCMRYWHPLSEEVIKEVEQYNPQEIVLLPLYPQYSTTTTGSSFKLWYTLMSKLKIPVKEIVDYPVNELFIKSICEKLNFDLSDSMVLFTAHGLPQSIVDDGDPYQMQVQNTVQAILQQVNIKNYSLCYQSRVGPMKWITPYAEQEIIKYAKGNNIVVVPVSFVSEHSETLVELDIDYKDLAMQNDAKSYTRIATNGTCKFFIQALTELVKTAQGVT